MTITLETAERLVRNYADRRRDASDIIDNTDIFLIPVNNPDGANYSFYNFASQRKNMTNHCPDAQADLGNRNSLGRRPEPQLPRRVGLRRLLRRVQRLHRAARSRARPSCPSPRARTRSALAETFRNIKFMMSVHSNGGQLFWQPGAYIAERPDHDAAAAARPRVVLLAVRQPDPLAGAGAPTRDGRHPGERRRLVRRPVLVRGQRARGHVLQLRHLRVRLGGRRLGLQPGHRQLPGRLVPAAVGRRLEPRSAATARRSSTPTASSRCSASPPTGAATRRPRRRS